MDAKVFVYHVGDQWTDGYTVYLMQYANIFKTSMVIFYILFKANFKEKIISV